MPYDPLAQAELDQQRAEQNSASPTSSPEAQQAAAEHAVRLQQSYESSPSHQASLAHAAERESQKAQRTAQEAHYRSQGIPTWTGADGNLYPDTHKLTEQAAKDQAAAAKAQAKADKDAADLAAKQQRAEAIRSERKHRINPVDGTPIYLESEQDLAKRQQTEFEKTRKAQLDAQIHAAEAEHGATLAQHEAAGIKPLSPTARKNLAGDPLDKEKPGLLHETKQEARQALLDYYQNLSTKKSGDADWIPFNEAPTPEATAAQQHIARLSAPDADLTDEDLATLTGNDATKPILTRLQNQQQLLAKDDELQKLHASHALRVADLKLRRDAPDQWAESLRARRAAMSPEELKADLEASSADLDARTAALQQQATSLNEQVAAHTQQLDALAQQAEARRQQGIPAGDLVAYQDPDGTVEHWPKDLAAQREAVMARLQDTQSQQQSDWAALKAQEKELQQEAALHNEAAQLLQTTQKAKIEEAKQADLSHLQFTPGHEQTAQELAALDEESQSRLAALQEQYQGNPPPEALDALQQDIQQRSRAALAMGDARRLAAQSAYAGIQHQLQEYQANPDKKGDVGDLWINTRKNLAEALQIPEAKAMQMLEDAEAEHDWDKVLGRFHESTPSGEWKSWKNALTDDSDPRQTRILSNGGIVVNPSITDEAKYKAAVESAKASPEAKAAALARYPQIRQRMGQNVLDTLKEIESTFGADTLKDWHSYAKQRPKDVSEQDWALKFSEKLKADTAASPWTSLLKRVMRSGAQGLYDLRQQGSGFIAGITGSEAAMQDAQWAGRKAEALGATKELEGTVGHNFLSRGVFDQLPRLAGSILPAAGGAKLAQGGIKLFAATSLGSRFLPSLASALTQSSTPAQAVRAVQTLTRAGLGGTAAAAGLQTYGSQLADIYGTLRREDPSLTHQQALSAAQQPALLSAAVTALLTTAGGAHGIEKLLINPAAAKEVFKKQFTSQLQRAGFLGASFASGAAKELLEELPDELFSQYQAAVASHPHDAQAGTKAIAQFMQQLPELSVAIGLLGGGGEAISDSQGTTINNGQPPSTTVNLPETQAAADAAIQNHRHLDANNVEIPEFTQATQQRAALALATARGGDLFDATEKQLNAAGWTRRDSQGRDMPPGKFARLKDYTGPNVLNIDTAGRAHIDPQYLTSLKEQLPAVAAAIPSSATVPVAPDSSNEPQSTTANSNTTSQSGNPPAGQTPANGPGPNANPAAVQNPPVQGAQPPPSGTPPSQSGSEVAAKNSKTPASDSDQSPSPPSIDGSGSDSLRPLAANSPTSVPTVEKSIADWLVDRHMPDKEAAAAAAAIVAHPDMAGKDYDHFTRQITARDQILQSLGITGSTSKKQAATNPLRFSSPVQSPASENSANSVNPVQTSGSGNPAPPALPPSVQAALDDSIPGTPSPEVFDAIKKAVQAKELTEQAATTLVAQQTGAQDHTELRQSLENKLGWNTTRANTAAALHFGDKTQSPIPLAAAERAPESTAAKNTKTPASVSASDPNSPPPIGGSESGSLRPLAANSPASSLTQNDDYARAKLAALSRIQDPAKKTWARQFFTLFEKSFERHHLLYDALGTGAAARKHLGGQFTAVMSIGGKVTRLIDLDAMVGQFSHIESPAAAVRATGIEEDVHALVLQLSRKNPEKYGYPALVKKWKALPDKLKQAVWQSYNNANASIQQNTPLPANLSSKDEWLMMNEFLRMLVQDKHFAGQITESVDASPGLIQWVKDLLKDLGNILRSLLKNAPPALQSEINSMVAELGQRLKDIETPSTTTAGTRLETIPTLADTQAVTQQALTTLLQNGQGILSHAALARIWDQLDPSLQSRVFQHFKTSDSSPPIGGSGSGSDSLRPFAANSTAATRRAPKHELMQELLTLLLTDPAAAQSLLESPPKSTTLLAKLTSALFGRPPANLKFSVPSSQFSVPVPAPLATLHAQTLRLLGTLSGVHFVQSLSPGLTQAITTAPPPVAAKALASRITPESTAAKNTKTTSGSDLNSQPSIDGSASDPLRLLAANSPASAPEPLHPRAADFLAALEAAEAQLERDHTDASNDTDQSKLRAKLRLQQVAATRTQFFLRDNAAREQHQATQAGRQDVEKATALQDLALGRIGQRRPAAAWRTLGIAERRRLALLGIGVDQNPSGDQGGYPYSLSRIESAELRLEFSLAGTPEHQLAQEELDYMRQQPADHQTALDPLAPAYVERDHVIIKQSALDDLALSYPHTAALIRPEWQTRQSYGLRVDARAPESLATKNTKTTPSDSEPIPSQPSIDGSASDPLRLFAANPPPSENPVQTSVSGSGIPLLSIPLQENSGTKSPTPPSLSFPIPLTKRGQVRRATFPDADSLAAFQFKLDADTIANRRSTPSEVSKAEQRGLSLLARLMQDSPLGRAELEQKLLDYHRTLVQQAEAASAFGTFTPPPFHAFATEGSAGSPARSGNLPPPVGGDIISGLQSQGIRRLGPPDASDGWSWYRALQQDASLSKLKNAEAQRLARAGDITDPKARLFWLNDNVVSQTSGRSIDEAATELSESEDQQFPVTSGEELGQAILAALDARLRAAQTPIADPETSSIQQERENEANFATYAAGTPGQSFTAAELSKELQPEDELQIGTEYLTVLETDPASGLLTLDSSRFGPVTATGPQVLNLTSGPNHLRISKPSSSGPSEKNSVNPAPPVNPVQNQSPESLTALRAALPAGTQRDILKPSPVESTLKDGTLPAATPQDAAALDEDLRTSIAAGNALDSSAPQIDDADLEDEIADQADAYLDGETLGAALRTRHDATFSPAIQTPLGSLERYTWQHKLDDVWDNRAGEYQTKRVSDWDKAITNAETGRDIVHHFDIRKPDGSLHTVSLESALGSLSPEQKKSTTGIIRALRRLPMNEALLQAIQDKQRSFMEAYNQAKSQGWKSAPSPELREPDFPALQARGVKQLFIGKTFYRNYEPSETPSQGDIREAKERWAVEQITTPGLIYDEHNKLDSLPRIIKKDRQTLKTAGVSITPASPPAVPSPNHSPSIILPASQRTPAKNQEQGTNNFPFTPAVRINGRVETAPLHYDAWITQALRHIPAHQKDGLDHRQLIDLADQWMRKNPGFLANSEDKEGFMTSQGFLNRKDALKHFLALGHEQTLYPGEQRDWLDSTDVEHAAHPTLFAAPRKVPHPLAFPRSSDTLSPDAALRSPSHILASLFPDAARESTAAFHAAGNDVPNVSQRGKPRPSVGGHPADFARILDWAKTHHRISAPQGFQLSVAPDLVAAFAAAPSSAKIPGIYGGGEHFVVPSWDGYRLYKFTKPGQLGAQALDGPAYLERLALSNRIWGDDFKFEGFTRFPGDQDWRAVISQPFYAAADPTQPDATMPDILAFLQSQGWHPFEGYHVHPIHGLQLWDIQTPGNLIATAGGPMPVDLQLEPADPSRLRRLRAEIQQGPRTPIFAAPRTPESPAAKNTKTPASDSDQSPSQPSIDGSGPDSLRPLAANPQSSENPEIPANFVNPVQNLDSASLPAASRLKQAVEKTKAIDRKLDTIPGTKPLARALDKSVTTLGQTANLLPTAVGKVVQGITATGQHIPGNQALAAFGTALGKADAAAAAKVGTTVANALQRVSGKDIRKAPDAVAAWLNKPDGLGSWTKSVVVDQFLPTALMPREWLALSHEMQRKTAFGAEKSNDLIRALSGNPRLSDLAYPEEFAKNPAYREQLFDAMENKIPWSSLPPAMQALGTQLRAMLRETGLELVKQGLMHPDTFEELQANGWMPRYMLEEAQESGGSVLAAFKLGVKDLLQQRSTAWHIVDTTRKGKDGQYLTVNRKEGGRNAWRFRDAATRDAFYSDFIRQQALDMLQETHGNTKELQTMMATLDGQQRREVRAQIKLLTRADMDSTQKLSPALAGMVKAAIEHQKSIYRKEAPFDPPKLIKDPVYAIARYILAQTHNAATMELLNETAKNKDWTSNVSLQGFVEIPDNDRFGPLAGKFVQKDIAQQILDKLDVPNAAIRFYDAILRKWKSGKLVWNPGSHIRDAVGNTVFAYLGGSSIFNPGNWPYYRQALELMRGSATVSVASGSTTYAELLEHGVLGGDAYSSLVRERLKGLLPDAKTVENFNPGLLQRFFLDFGSKFHATHEQLAEYRRMPDDFYKIAAYLKAKAEFTQQLAAKNSKNPNSPPSIDGSDSESLRLLAAKSAAAHVRKWFPYYDRLGGSATTRAAGRFVNPFLSFFRESTRILATAAAERPIALSAALAFPAAISALSAMLLGLDDRDRDEIAKDLAGRGKGILGLSDLHLFSMLLPFRSGQGQVQQFDISAIMPFADLLGQKIVPLEEKENAWQTFWRQTAAAGPIGNLGVSWITNRDLFSGRHLTEADMSTPEMISAYAQHAANVALPPLAPDLAHLVGIGEGGALSRAGQRQTNKTLQTYDATQTIIRSVLGMNVKSAAPNIYRQADDFRKAHGYDAQPDFDYGTTVTSRVKRALVQQLAQDQPNPAAIKNLVKRLKDLGVPLDTPGAITKVLKIIDPASIIGGSKKQNLTAEDARQRFRQSLPPESRALYEASLREFQKIQSRAPSLLRAAQ